MKQTYPKTKPTSTEKQLEPQAVWSHLTSPQQQTILRAIELVCQDLVRQLTKPEVTSDTS